jgi:hypothetical protein
MASPGVLPSTRRSGAKSRCRQIADGATDVVQLIDIASEGVVIYWFVTRGALVVARGLALATRRPG